VRRKSRRGKISLAIWADAFRLFLQGRNSGRGRNRLTEDVHLTFRLGRIAAAIRVVTEFGQLENASLDRSVKVTLKNVTRFQKQQAVQSTENMFCKLMSYVTYQNHDRSENITFKINIKKFKSC
jgi:hypothetical protein